MSWPSPFELLMRGFAPVAQYPEIYAKKNAEARQTMGEGWEAAKAGKTRSDVALGLGQAALGGMGFVASPIDAAISALVGNPVEKAFGIPAAQTDFLTSMAIPGYGMAKLPQQAGQAAVRAAPAANAVKKGTAEVDQALSDISYYLKRGELPPKQASLPERATPAVDPYTKLEAEMAEILGKPAAAPSFQLTPKETIAQLSKELALNHNVVAKDLKAWGMAEDGMVDSSIVDLFHKKLMNKYGTKDILEGPAPLPMAPVKDAPHNAKAHVDIYGTIHGNYLDELWKAGNLDQYNEEMDWVKNTLGYKNKAQKPAYGTSDNPIPNADVYAKNPDLMTPGMPPTYQPGAPVTLPSGPPSFVPTPTYTPPPPKDAFPATDIPWIKSLMPTNPVDEATRQARIAEQGYEPVYHGARRGWDTNFVQANEDSGNRFFMAMNPELAEMYASGMTSTSGKKVEELRKVATNPGANIMPLMYRAPDYHTYDAKGGLWLDVQSEAFREARKEGKKGGVVLKNVYDEPNSPYKGTLPPQDVVIAFDPSTIRSAYAQFDPAKKNVNDLLASWIGPIAAGGMTAPFLGWDNER